MKIEVIMRYYRDELFIPLFMQHYAPWVEKITLLTHKYPDNKLVELTGLALVNEEVKKSEADWLIVADSDEFIFPKPYGTDPRKVLESEKDAEFIFCEMPRVWRHTSDRDLNFFAPPIPQRVHGQPLETYSNESKPILFRPSPHMLVGVGHHSIHYPGGRPGKPWGGAHWRTADPVFEERILRDRKNRISASDLEKGFSIHYQGLTHEHFVKEFKSRESDPVVIALQ